MGTKFTYVKSGAQFEASKLWPAVTQDLPLDKGDF